jgi:hypothetical protein
MTFTTKGDLENTNKAAETKVANREVLQASNQVACFSSFQSAFAAISNGFRKCLRLRMALKKRTA